MRLNTHTSLCSATVLLFCCLIFCACSGGGDPAGGGNGVNFAPPFNPARFVSGVDNPYFPLLSGSHWVYQEGSQTVDVLVTGASKTVLGVVCVEVHDSVSEGGELVEDTYDWYAQDTDGNVWYMGEDTAEYAGGVVTSTEGSWEAGVNGAAAGIILPAQPATGQIYRQEYYAGHAEDEGEILELGATATTPFGDFSGCIRTHDFSSLETSVNENKYYAAGVGIVLSIDVNTGQREELISFSRP